MQNRSNCAVFFLIGCLILQVFILDIVSAVPSTSEEYSSIYIQTLQKDIKNTDELVAEVIDLLKEMFVSHATRLSRPIGANYVNILTARMNRAEELLKSEGAQGDNGPRIRKALVALASQHTVYLYQQAVKGFSQLDSISGPLTAQGLADSARTLLEESEKARNASIVAK